MDIKSAVEASRARVPVMHRGIKYKRITARITRINECGGESYSLELQDYCGSAVMVAAIGEVEVAEGNDENDNG